jgi:outer membrane murein-binding lipoprotein Lpp
MATTKEKATPKAAPAPAKAEKKAPPARKNSRTIGMDIMRACAYAGVSAPAGAVKLSKDVDLTHAALTQLKTDVIEIAAKLRALDDDNKRVCALALGHILMGVQRLEREAK